MDFIPSHPAEVGPQPRFAPIAGNLCTTGRDSYFDPFRDDYREFLGSPGAWAALDAPGYVPSGGHRATWAAGNLTVTLAEVRR